MHTFEPISIKMAKEQGLSLNPTKISGVCGRLMCCLTFENPTYQHLKKKMPRLGKPVTLEQGTGKVVRQNILKQSITVRMDDRSEIEVAVSELKP
jgi:cell fate regulator YaaT (PSP1 superfamily)